MMSAVGMKKNSAAMVQMASDDGPELAAEAIQRRTKYGGDVEEEERPRSSSPGAVGI